VPGLYGTLKGVFTLMEDKQPTYEELLAKVREQEAQEEIFRTVIKQMENLYAQIASSQTEIEQKNQELK